MSDFRYTLGGNLLHILSQITHRSGRFQISGFEYFTAANASGKPIIFVAWHGMTMMLVGFFVNHYDITNFVLPIPDDWRGETLYIFARKVGAHSLRLNLKGDATMATARKLAQLVRLVKQGKNSYITPDGPEGPAYVMKPGVAYIARKAEAIILPVGAYARHGYRLNRWDQYILPYPFSRISIHVGAPVMVGSEDDLTAVTQSLTDSLHRVTAQAAANYYES